jgi:hypothetical protein
MLLDRVGKSTNVLVTIDGNPFEIRIGNTPDYKYGTLLQFQPAGSQLPGLQKVHFASSNKLSRAYHSLYI